MDELTITVMTAIQKLKLPGSIEDWKKAYVDEWEKVLRKDFGRYLNKKPREYFLMT